MHFDFSKFTDPTSNLLRKVCFKIMPSRSRVPLVEKRLLFSLHREVLRQGRRKKCPAAKLLRGDTKSRNATSRPAESPCRVARLCVKQVIQGYPRGS
jgi:hypothetical protein